jgi:2'-5' RNA ligase
MGILGPAGYAGKDIVRVFFAIWPDCAVRERLLEIGDSLQRNPGFAGRRIKAENIHLTLVFVGNVDRSGLDALCGAAEGIAKIRKRPFELVIQEVGCWKHNHIVYAAPRRIPLALKELVSSLRKAIESVGFSTEERTYKPHVTLMRDATCPGLPQRIEPVAWEVREWLLVKSEQTREGVVYSPVGRWVLGTSG